MSQQEDLKKAALEYHRQHPPGKIAVVATKPMVTQRDPSLAYSPGVAYACEAIVEDPNAASEMTARGNLVAVITNGTAVLGPVSYTHLDVYKRQTQSRTTYRFDSKTV